MTRSLMVLAILLAVTGCSCDKRPEMGRKELIAAYKECHDAGLEGQRVYNNGFELITVDVTCVEKD